MSLIQFRAVLVLECEPSVGPPTPFWIQSYKSLYMSRVGFSKLPNSLPAWQVALASVVSPSHSHPVEIDGAQYQDVNSLGHIDLCAAIYADISEERYMENSIAVSIGPENSERSNAKRSKTKYFENHTLAGYASNLHAGMSQSLHEEPYRYYGFKISKTVDDRSYRSLNKVKTFRPRLARKLSTSNKYLAKVLRGSKSRDKIETSTEESNKTASSTILSPTDDLGEFAMGHETLKYITELTEAYLLRDDVQASISECAQTLVERRRHREQLDPTRWDRECYGLRYKCVYGNCMEDDVEYADQDTLRYHLEQRHPLLPLSEDEFTSILNRCMVVELQYQKTPCHPSLLAFSFSTPSISPHPRPFLYDKNL